MNVCLVAVLLVALLGGAPASASSDSFVQDTRADADWILAAQLPDGAIAHHVDRVAVWPYLANFAAMGLAAASVDTGDGAYAAAAWRWARWYQDHQDGRGFVTDYRVVGGRLQSTGDMDSTDAYAGTYLLAVREVWLATADAASLRGVAPGVARAVDAIEATQDTDGLTWAKPAWHVKYLMDQAETYGGLIAAVDLARALGDERLAARAQAAASRLESGVAATWNPATGAYDWAVHGDGAHIPTDWGQLYPDAMQQAWAVGFGLVRGERAAQLMTTFAARQRSWSDPGASATIDGATRKVGYWAPAAWAFAKVGNLAEASSAADRLERAAVASGRAWPFTPGDAGRLVVLRRVARSRPAARPPAFQVTTDAPAAGATAPLTAAAAGPERSPATPIGPSGPAPSTVVAVVGQGPFLVSVAGGAAGSAASAPSMIPTGTTWLPFLRPGQSPPAARCHGLGVIDLWAPFLAGCGRAAGSSSSPATSSIAA